MGDNTFLEIRYDAFQYNEGVEDFRNIDEFKAEVKSNYNSVIKPTPTGRGGGAYEFLINFICDLHLQDYLKIVALYFGAKIISNLSDKSIEHYLFIPLIKAYNKLKKANKILDCYKMKLEFEDATVYIYKTNDNSIFSNFKTIITELEKSYSELVKDKELRPTEIHIPAIKDNLRGKLVFRPPFEMEEYENWSKEFLFDDETELLSNSRNDEQFQLTTKGPAARIGPPLSRKP